MEISSANSTPSAIQVEVMKKEQDTKEMQGQQDLKVLEDITKQSQEMTAQKTGIGGNINITG
jgi:hypothetical protein